MTAAPIGPIGVLITKRTLVKGRVSGIISGLGAATADGIYASLAVFSVGAVSFVLVKYSFIIALIGSLFMFYMGYLVYKAKIDEHFKEYHEHGSELLGDFVSTLFLTLTNPTTIISFSAIFASFGLSDLSGDVLIKISLVIGFILGSFTWFYCLSSLVNKLRLKFTVTMLEIVNRFAGVIIMLFATLYFLSNFTIGTYILQLVNN